MGFVADNILQLKKKLPDTVTLVAVSKTKPVELINEAYQAGQYDFGENYVQELLQKYVHLPKDILWHFIGHLQSNKVKYIAPFVHLIHGVDSFKLLKEINKQAIKNNRIINCLIQIHIAREETKFGMNENELLQMLSSADFNELKNIKISGIMGMASNTSDENTIRKEFAYLSKLFHSVKNRFASTHNLDFTILSMGMSSDWEIALQEGSNMIRIGSSIFGKRHYTHI